MSERVVFILPGYKSNIEEDNYQRVAEIYRETGFNVEELDIEWSRDFWENCEKAEKMIVNRLEKYSSPEIHFFGHSWGAAILLTLSPEYDPDSQLLASLSPEFKEDDHEFPTIFKLLNPVARIVFGLFYDLPEKIENRPSIRDISKNIDSDIYLIYAEREYKGLWGIDMMGIGGKLTDRRKKILDCEEIIANDATHSMDSEAYLKEISKIVGDI